MAATVVYTTFLGQIVHENRGGVERDYMPDTLGSTIALLDSSQNQTDTWSYWPYGEVATRTGTNPTPFTFGGTLGYFKDALTRLYVRARVINTNLGSWFSCDPYWPREQAYGYAGQDPIALLDPTGTFWQLLLCSASCLTGGSCVAGVWIACGKLSGQPEFGQCVQDYIQSLPPHSQAGCLLGILGCLACLARYLSKGGTNRICPPPVKACLMAAQDAICSLPHKCKGNQTCATLRKNAGIFMGCIAARLAVMFACYGGGNGGHWESVGQQGRGFSKCLGMMLSKNCFGSSAIY